MPSSSAFPLAHVAVAHRAGETPAAIRDALRRYSPTLIGPPAVDLTEALSIATRATSTTPTAVTERRGFARP